MVPYINYVYIPGLKIYPRSPVLKEGNAWFSLGHKHKQKYKRRFSKWEHLLHKQNHKKNERVRSSCAYAYVAVFTNENGGDKRTLTSTRQSSVSSTILLNIEGSWYRELCQEMIFCACACPYAAYVTSVLTCLFLCLCLCLCPIENQP